LAEALDMAEDMLLCNIEDFFDMDEAVPDAVARGDHYVRLPLLVRMKVLLHNEMLKQHISQAQLARLLDTTPQEVRSILRVRHNTQPAMLEQALAALNTHVELAVTA
jgi:toxin-antitoxin system, antitoxin component, hicB family